jgi:protein-S-isoprenylcysteine O-methyltransferase Ste14
MSPTTDARPKSRPPRSVTHFGVNMLGALAALVTLYVLHEQRMSGPNAVLVVCAAGVVPIILLDVLVLRVHRRETTGIDWDKDPTPDVGRCLTKLLGLGVTVGLIALAYLVFPEYGDWYGAFWSVLRRFWALLVVGSITYVWFVDGRMRDPYDAYWQLGRVVLLHPSDARRGEIANHFRGWLVKAFFIPLFVVFVHNQLNEIITYDLRTVHASNLRLYDFLTKLIYAVDVLYATVGYCLAFRVLDSHLRTAEPTMLGWVVALECYSPFWPRLASTLYLHYDGIGFEAWLAGHQELRWGWAAVIVGLEGIYLLATFAFGVRFSNLTHRGILTNGPYRFTKHPAYVAKNLSWWMITLPFIPHGAWLDSVKSTLALGGVSAIYFLRARTEERHLSRDPTYVEYAMWMNEHGLLRFLNRVPLFRYRPPSAPAPTPPAAPEPAGALSSG